MDSSSGYQDVVGQPGLWALPVRPPLGGPAPRLTAGRGSTASRPGRRTRFVSLLVAAAGSAAYLAARSAPYLLKGLIVSVLRFQMSGRSFAFDGGVGREPPTNNKNPSPAPPRDWCCRCASSSAVAIGRWMAAR
jgi:hypothetical protein